MNYAYQNQSQVSSTGSDRLKKAIERNRAKQAKREQSETIELSKSGSGFKPSTQNSWEMVQARKAAPESSRESTLRSRTGVANGNNTEFVTPLRERLNKAPATASYVSPSAPARTSTRTVTPVQSLRKVTVTPRARVTPLKSRDRRSLQDYLIIAGWAFCSFLLLRLVFSDRGVIDYYKKKDFLASKVFQMRMIEQDNSILFKEIERIEKDYSYQKKIVREHLGFIAGDEYLLLFAKEKQISSL